MFERFGYTDDAGFLAPVVPNSADWCSRVNAWRRRVRNRV